MNRKQGGSNPAFIEQMARAAWREFPGHFGGALSKILVGPEKGGTARVDFRISRYAPSAYVEEHAHKVQEQIYYVVEGEGILTVDGEPRLMRPHDYVYLPPGVRHGFSNTGTDGLVFFVVTTPASDEEAA
jgi:quercetin dioxygenase-like cupin family protein